MKRWFTNPQTKQFDPIMIATLLCLTLVTLKFLFEGCVWLNFGHADFETYAAVLAPLLGHSASREWKIHSKKNKSRVDNPDGEK